MKTMNATGAILARNSPKPRPAADPMRMFGGSPTSVAAPPILDARISLMRYGIGETPRTPAMYRVTGAMSTTVVTLSRNADRTAVQDAQDQQQPIGLAPGDLDRSDGDPLEEAGPAQDAGQDHHPDQQEDDVQVDRGEGRFLVDDAKDHDQGGTKKGSDRLVDALGGDQRIRDEEDDPGGNDLHRIGQPAVDGSGSSASRYRTVSSSRSR